MDFLASRGPLVRVAVTESSDDTSLIPQKHSSSPEGQGQLEGNTGNKFLTALQREEMFPERK
jgi:hypothetical protein